MSTTLLLTGLGELGSVAGQGDVRGAAAAVRARMGGSTAEVPTNHVAMVSHPDEVAGLIQLAAKRRRLETRRRGGEQAPRSVRD